MRGGIGARATAATGAALLMLTMSGCRDDGRGADPSASPDRGEETTVAGPSDAGGGSAAPAPGPTPTTATAPVGPGSRCGDEGGWTVVVAQGEVACETAVQVVHEFESTDDLAPGGRPASAATVQGWACEPILFAKMGFEPDTYSTWCAQGDAAILTMDSRVELPVQGPIMKPVDYAVEGLVDDETHWGFLTPSGTWYCGLVDNPRPEDGLETGAHCFLLSNDGIAGTAVDQPGGSGTATAVALGADGVAEAYYSGDIALAFTYEQTPRTLEYGQVLYARGGACTVAQDTGVTCTRSDGHGFTVSTAHGLTAR